MDEGEPRGGGTEVVVVGAGVIGLALSWRLAQAGCSVTMVDDDTAGGASHVAAGMLCPVTEAHYGEEALTALNLESARRWPAFAAELEAASGRTVGYRAEGTLAVAFDDDDLCALLDLRAYQERLGLPGERLAGRECRSLEPLLSPRIRGGILVTADHQVETRAVTGALLVAAQRAGVRHVPARAARIDAATDGRIIGVTLAAGESLRADVTVLAAGAWSGQIPGLPPGAVPPVRPVKGQILRLAGAGTTTPALRRTVRALRRGRSLYAVPRGDGRVVVGATTEEQGWDTRVTAGAVRELLEDAIEVVPALGELELVEATARLRPATPDNAPVLGPAGVGGLVLATGHYRNGFLLAPVTAEAITTLVLTGRLPALAAPFAAGRFTREAALR